MSLFSEIESELEDIVARFESGWRGHDLGFVRAHIPDGSRLAEPVLRELVQTDLELSIKADELVRVEEYLRAFPHLVNDDDFVAELVNHEFQLRSRRETQLNPAEYEARFPGLSLRQPDGASPNESPCAAGERFGVATSDGSRFHLKRLHRKGGLGKVWIGVDSELDREVAIKEIREDYASDLASRARFVDEAVITSQLEHPAIVPVYGLGQRTDGRPYYAMRLVRGKSLKQAILQFYETDWKSRGQAARTIGLRRLLGHFLDVCNAVHYAHGRGILHRDLKPSNVMLGEYGETVVIDWGLARHLDAASREDTRSSFVDRESKRHASTAAGRVLGSPAYMSPEQAAGMTEALGPTTDVYGLGATLYTLLTNRAPFEADTTEEMLKLVEAGQIASPRTISSEVSPSLAAICTKAMSLDSSDRYTSVRALADDIEHFLADEAVVAKPDTSIDRWRRYARRNQALVRASVIALIASAVFATVTAIVINNHRRRAEELADSAIASEQKSQRVLDYLINAINKPELAVSGHELTVAMVLADVASQLEDQFPDDPDVQAGLFDALAEAYANLGMFDQALEYGEKAQALKQSISGSDSADSQFAIATLAEIYGLRGDTKRAIAMLEPVCDRLDSHETADRSKSMLAKVALMRAYVAEGHHVTAVQHGRELAARVDPSWDPNDRVYVIDALSDALLASGKFEEAIQGYRDAWNLCRAEMGETNHTTLAMTDNYAQALMSIRQFSEAQALLEPLFADETLALDRNHPNVVMMLQKLAQCRIEGGDRETAIPMLEDCQSRIAESLGPTHPSAIDCLNNLAIAHARMSELDRATEILEEVVELSSQRFEANHPTVLTHQNNLAHAYGDLSRLEEAISLLRVVVDRRLESLGVEHPHTLQSMNSLALFLRQTDQVEESLQLLERVLPAKRKVFGEEHPETIVAMHDFACGLLRNNELSRARIAAEDYLDVTRRANSDYQPIALSVLGEVLYGQDRFDEAKPILEEAVGMFGGQHHFRAYDRVLLGRIAIAEGRLDDAKELLVAGAKEVDKTHRSSPRNYRRKFTAESMVALHKALGNDEKVVEWQKVLDSMNVLSVSEPPEN